MAAPARSSALLGTLLALVVVAVGVAGVVAGERDDSPGLQALGALLVLGAVTLRVRSARRRRRPPAA
ncbi:MAG: hypothetical protein AVDCRST_MAG48-2236 [uncultured Friedmanniella sp.]|uniref:Uncharacterized protein n=1 Tax=uncultured Friedmanniella sp. TaxID=335381 RepID=A0A6J4KTE6_9ACTN|nr:MAG: hypothetical protein AVDCRST_MAG48-2236 [uncultured Friedmanniella sp.]